jgi:hypothetical protein
MDAMPLRNPGITMPVEMHNRLQRSSRREDDDGNPADVSVSAVAREHIQVGFAVEDALANAGLDVPPGRDRAAFARQAVLELARRELREGESDSGGE